MEDFDKNITEIARERFINQIIKEDIQAFSPKKRGLRNWFH